MAELIVKGVNTAQGVAQIDYNSLANKPTPIVAGTTDVGHNSASSYPDGTLYVVIEE